MSKHGADRYRYTEAKVAYLGLGGREVSAKGCFCPQNKAIAKTKD
jgi:CO dehydrogenase nickel-insertion accessory protein CooC1